MFLWRLEVYSLRWRVPADKGGVKQFVRPCGDQLDRTRDSVLHGRRDDRRNSHDWWDHYILRDTDGDNTDRRCSKHHRHTRPHRLQTQSQTALSTYSQLPQSLFPFNNRPRNSKINYMIRSLTAPRLFLLCIVVWLCELFLKFLLYPWHSNNTEGRKNNNTTSIIIIITAII